MTDVESAHPTQSDPNNQAMFTRFDCVNCLLSETKLEIVAKAVKLQKNGKYIQGNEGSQQFTQGLIYGSIPFKRAQNKTYRNTAPYCKPQINNCRTTDDNEK